MFANILNKKLIKTNEEKFVGKMWNVNEGEM